MASPTRRRRWRRRSKNISAPTSFFIAPSPEGLVARQAAAWDPLVDWARDALGARFVLAEGLVHVAQPAQALAAARAPLPDDATSRSDVFGGSRINTDHRR